MMCEQFPKYQPSDVFGIADETIAAAFNLAASYRLFAFKSELENDRLQALALASTAAVFGGGQRPDSFEGFQGYE